MGILELFLSFLQALEYFARAPNLRRTINRHPSRSVLPNCRLLRIALFNGAAWFHLLEHCGGPIGESLGNRSRHCHVGNAHRRDRMCGISAGAVGFSNWMAAFA